MTRPPWGFGLDPTAAWLLAHGLPSSAEAPRAPLDEHRWADLRSACLSHRLDGLLVHAVAAGLLATADEQRREVAELEVELTRAQMTAESRLLATSRSLRGAGIEHRVLKGLALAVLDYPDPLMRPTTDVDLVVRADQLADAVEVLRGAGGTVVNPEPLPGLASTTTKGLTVEMADGFEVDLHRLLVWGPIGVRLPPDDLWRPGRSFGVGDERFEALDRERTLVHACLHLVVGGSRRGLTLRDVAQLLTAPGLDADEVLGVATRWGARAAVVDAIALTARELRLDPDLALVGWARRQQVPWRDRLWLRVDRPGAPLGPLQAPGVLLELPSASQRWAFLRATVAPTGGTWPSPARRLARVLQRNARSVRRRAIRR